MIPIFASSTQAYLLIYVGGGGFVLLGSFFFGRLVTFFFPKNPLIRNVKKKMNEPEFLKVKPGDTVLVGEDEIAKVLSFSEGQDSLMLPNFFKLQALIQAKLNFDGEEIKQILLKHQ